MLAVSLVDRVAEILTRYNMLPPGARIGVAVSGGADSVVLFHVLHSLAQRFDIRLTVLHLNHQLRGAESHADEQFVRHLAASFDVPVFSETAVLPAGNLEQEARSARRAFFTRIRHQESLDRVALGHTRSDQAETVLYRLLRGSGTAGLAGMRLVAGGWLIRPLLHLSRGEVREWARAEGIRWREDSSNDDSRFVRNRLRNETLPLLTAAYNPNLESVLANTAAMAQAEEDYWDQEITPICDQLAIRRHPGLLIDVTKLTVLHPAVQRRVIRALLARVRGNLRSVDLAHIDAVLAISTSTHGHDRVLLPGIDALRSFDTLVFAEPGSLNSEQRQYQYPLELGTWRNLPGHAGAIYVDYMKSEVSFCDTFKSEEDFPFEVAEVNRSVLSDVGLIRPLYVRNWEPGDQIHRPGHSRPEKLKSLFGEYKILLWERRHWPVVVCDGEIVWTRRFGCSAKFKASEPDTSVIRLLFKPS